jgi:hypothetical protein
MTEILRSNIKVFWVIEYWIIEIYLEFGIWLLGFN